MATVEVVFSSSRGFSPPMPPKPTAAGLFGSPNFVFLFGGEDLRRFRSFPPREEKYSTTTDASFREDEIMRAFSSWIIKSRRESIIL